MSTEMPSSATVTTGDAYVGNQQFKGMGSQRWCLFCKGHRMPGNGSMRRMFGSLHWVCADHPKPTKDKK